MSERRNEEKNVGINIVSWSNEPQPTCYRTPNKTMYWAHSSFRFQSLNRDEEECVISPPMHENTYSTTTTLFIFIICLAL